jgi:hypothetical protein
MAARTLPRPDATLGPIARGNLHGARMNRAPADPFAEGAGSGHKSLYIKRLQYIIRSL